MSGVALKPRKRIRHEILSLVPLAVVAGALFFAFPSYKFFDLLFSES